MKLLHTGVQTMSNTSSEKSGNSKLIQSVGDTIFCMPTNKYGLLCNIHCVYADIHFNVRIKSSHIFRRWMTQLLSFHCRKCVRFQMETFEWLTHGVLLNMFTEFWMDTWVFMICYFFEKRKNIVFFVCALENKNSTKEERKFPVELQLEPRIRE